MTGFAAGPFVAGLLATAGVVALLLAGTLLVALVVGRHAVVDVAWGLGFTAVAAVTYLSSAGHGDPARRALVTVMVAVWGVRLATHIAWRARGKGEDPRYEQMLARAPGNRTWYAVRMVYLLQGALVWFVSLPVQVSGYSAAGLGPVAWAGVAVWGVGLAFEAVGDWQLARFKDDPANRGAVMDRGLWRYTRHPNYFGDTCVWWGLFIVAASAWPGVLTVASPAVMTFFLVAGTGKKLTEDRMAGRPGFAQYVQRTSGFWPRPPRRMPAG